jgi:hypothetical protein
MDFSTRFPIGVFLEDPRADPLSFTFHRDVFGADVVIITVPQGQAWLADAVTVAYLQQRPEDGERVGVEAVLRAVQRAIKENGSA